MPLFTNNFAALKLDGTFATEATASKAPRRRSPIGSLREFARGSLVRRAGSTSERFRIAWEYEQSEKTNRLLADLSWPLSKVLLYVSQELNCRSTNPPTNRIETCKPSASPHHLCSSSTPHCHQTLFCLSIVSFQWQTKQVRTVNRIYHPTHD